MKFISDIADRARNRRYSFPHASAMVQIAALILVACAMAGCRVQGGRTHA